MSRAGVRLRVAAAALAIAATLTAGEARASFREAGAFTVNLRGGGQIRRDLGFGDDAAAFGFGRVMQGGGGGLELYFAPWKRLSFGLSFGGFSAAATRTTATLTLTSQAWLAHARAALWRSVRRAGKQEFLLQLEADAAFGVYSMKRTYEDGTLYSAALVASDRSWGARLGLDASVYWHAVGLVFGYGYAYSPAAVHDALGHGAQAGGHEITGALSLRW